MQTPSPDKTTQTQRREPLRWLAVAALLLAFLSICCVSQVVTYLLTPHNARSSLDLLSNNRADYKPWSARPVLPAIPPQVPAAQAAERADNTAIALQPTSGNEVPTAELAIVPPPPNAPTTTPIGVLVMQPTPTSTTRSVAVGPTSKPTDTRVPASGATATPVPSDTPSPNVPTDTPTNSPSDTPTPTNTPAPQPFRTATPTPPIPTTPPTAVPTTPPTDTPAPTNTLQPTSTPRPTPRPTTRPTTRPTLPPTNTPTNTPRPTNTPTPTIATPTPTTGTPTPTPTAIVKVTKTVNPPNGSSPTNVVYKITIVNQSGALITLTRIDDDMRNLGPQFKGTDCIGPDGQPCPVPPSAGGQWHWQGTVDLANGASAVMTIKGQYSFFPPPGPGTPTPAPKSYCNKSAVVTYTLGKTSFQATSGQACFTLK